MLTPAVKAITTRPLNYPGDCGLLGVTQSLDIYVEETYADTWVAQHGLSLDGSLLISVDEDSGRNRAFKPLELPAYLVRPRPVQKTADLNFRGPRYRGLRDPERITSMVRSLAIQDKLNLIKQLDVDINPMAVLGLAESHVLAEARLADPDTWLVCLRLRLAYALPQECQDANNQPYDYDSITLHAIAVYDAQAEDDLMSARFITELDSIRIARPMDCLIHADHLVIADGGADDRVSAVHVFQIYRP